MKHLKILALLTILVSLAACGEVATTTNSAAVANVQPSPSSTLEATKKPTEPPTIGLATVTVVPPPATEVPKPTVAAQKTAVPVATAALPTARPVVATPVNTPVAATVKPTAPSITLGANPGSIRQTKWLDVLKNDPALEVVLGAVVGSVPDPSKEAPYYRVKDTEIGGIPLLGENIVYLDLNGDKVEEAAIPLLSGGTMGGSGFLIYKQANPQPRLIDSKAGYKLFLEVENNKLVAVNALYSDWDPNCCSSGLTFTTYEVKNDKLAQIAERNEGVPQAQPFTVTEFYKLLNKRKFQEAYKTLSATFQKANPYEAWVKGYANTKSVEAQVQDELVAKNTVGLTIVAVDTDKAGKETTKRFVGTWDLLWDTKAGHWVLDKPNIKEDIATGVKGTPNKIFSPLIAELQAQTKIELLLPFTIPGDDGTLPIYAIVEGVNPDAYTIQLAYTADCNGASVCRLGGVAGERVTKDLPAPAGTKTTLANKAVAYFVDATCGANCTDSTLKWEQNGVRYTFSLKAARIEALVEWANATVGKTLK